MHAACCVTRVIICINQIETFRTTEYLHTVHLLLAAVMHLTNWEIDCDQIL